MFIEYLAVSHVMFQFHSSPLSWCDIRHFSIGSSCCCGSGFFISCIFCLNIGRNLFVNRFILSFLRTAAATTVIVIAWSEPTQKFIFVFAQFISKTFILFVNFGARFLYFRIFIIFTSVSEPTCYIIPKITPPTSFFQSSFLCWMRINRALLFVWISNTVQFSGVMV